jgi:hypothetical protein
MLLLAKRNETLSIILSLSHLVVAKWGLGITLHDTKTVGYFLNLIWEMGAIEGKE